MIFPIWVLNILSALWSYLIIIKLITVNIENSNIHPKATADDQFMIKETVLASVKKHPEWSYPDIILVDGGKPQVTCCPPGPWALQSTRISPLLDLPNETKLLLSKPSTVGRKPGCPPFLLPFVFSSAYVTKPIVLPTATARN